MHIQIINGFITYYTPNSTISVNVETTEEIDQLIKQLEDYVKEHRTPEQVAVEEADKEREIAKENEFRAIQSRNEAYDKMAKIIGLFPEWKEEVAYETGKIVSFLGSLYKVLQPHTSQHDWRPDVSPSLFVDVTTRQVGEETGEVQEWEAPGSTNPYMTGDKVLFEGKTYESTIDNNVWSPIDYPQGWKEITE